MHNLAVFSGIFEAFRVILIKREFITGKR